MITTVLAVGSLVILVPLYFILAMSLKSGASSDASAGFALPLSPAFGNFGKAWEMVNAPTAFTWSVLISAIAVAGNIVLPAMVAWAVVRNWESRLFRGMFYYLLAAMFIPFTVLVLPQIKLMATLPPPSEFSPGSFSPVEADGSDDRHILVPAILERLHDAVAHHRKRQDADPSSRAGLVQ
ncbi:ABC-type glycerol-3-phosphate transport system permease component [Nakamurella sp. UYEF19]|uniref:hypothetical protein n=1 Tax=Nakamurella sp. UYEF19 TaxID=1756392 RepID=UPI0033982066